MTKYYQKLAARLFNGGENGGMSNNDKSIKSAFSAPESLVARAKKRAKEVTAGNYSNYMQSLIEADLSGKVFSVNEEEKILQVLFDRFLPAHKKDVEKWIKAGKVREQILLTKLLLDMARAIEKGADKENLRVTG